MSIVRDNIMNREGYAPYCGGYLSEQTGCRTGPRAPFNGSQFECPHCGWQSAFEPDFIKAYKEKWKHKK